MTDVNMDVPATVSWSEGPLDGEMNNGTGGFSRRFNTLGGAALFVANELPEAYRANAWISTEGHTFRPEELPELAAQAGFDAGAA